MVILYLLFNLAVEYDKIYKCIYCDTVIVQKKEDNIKKKNKGRNDKNKEEKFKNEIKIR